MNWISASDHRYLQTYISGISTKKFTGKRVMSTNWSNFHNFLMEYWYPPTLCGISSTTDIDHFVKKLTDAIIKAFKNATTYHWINHDSVPWWNNRLEELKKQVRRLLNQVRREIDPIRKEALREEYRRNMGMYKTEINKSRTQAWRKFCSQQADNLWISPYYVVRQKAKKNFLPNTICSDTNSTWAIEDTFLTILEDLFLK